MQKEGDSVQRILEKYLGKADCLEIYARPEAADRFDAGCVLAMDDQYVLLNTYDESGRDDGLSLRLLDHIICVQADTLYLKKLHLLEPPCPSKYKNWRGRQGDLLVALLEYAYETERGVGLELENGDDTELFGCLVEAPDEIITLRQLNSYGDDDGIAYLRRDQIVRADCDCIDVRKRICMAKR